MSWYKSIKQNTVYEADKPVDYDDILLPDKPSKYHIFDTAKNSWILSLDILKDIKKDEILEEFNSRYEGEFPYYSKTINKYINCSREALDDYIKLREKMKNSGDTTTSFRLYDNNFIEITIDQLERIINEMIDYGLELYQKKWRYEYLIDAATDIYDIISLQWED